MRILLINSNTNRSVTEKIKAEAKKWAGDDTNIDSANANFGADIVSTRSEAAISSHALLDACACYGKNADAIIVGMSLDTGVWAARELMAVPVIGMSEAALHMASMHGNRIGLLVFGGITQPYREMAEAYGYGPQIGAIEALGITPQEHLQDPDKAEAKITGRVEALAKAGQIDSVILVGAVAAGLPKKLQDTMAVPVFEGISCAVLLAESLVRLGASQPKVGSFVSPKGRYSDKLSDDLNERLRRD